MNDNSLQMNERKEIRSNCIKKPKNGKIYENVISCGTLSQKCQIS